MNSAKGFRNKWVSWNMWHQHKVSDSILKVQETRTEILKGASYRRNINLICRIGIIADSCLKNWTAVSVYNTCLLAPGILTIKDILSRTLKTLEPHTVVIVLSAERTQQINSSEQFKLMIWQHASSHHWSGATQNFLKVKKK